MRYAVSVASCLLLSMTSWAQATDEQPVEGRVEINVFNRLSPDGLHFVDRFVSREGHVVSAKYFIVPADENAPVYKREEWSACFRGDPIKAGELMKKMLLKANKEGNKRVYDATYSVVRNSKVDRPTLRFWAVDARGGRFTWFRTMLECASRS